MSKFLKSIFIALSLTSYNSFGQKLEKILIKAENAYETRRSRTAITLASQVLEKDSTNSKALYIRSRSYIHEKIFDSAYLDLVKYSQEIPDNQIVCNYWAKIGQSLVPFDYEKAHDSFLRIVKYNNNAQAQFNVGLTSLTHCHYQQAVMEFTKVLSMDLTNYMAHYYRSSCYTKLGDLELASIDIIKALDKAKNKKNGDLMILRGILLHKEGRDHLALEYLDNGLHMKNNLTKEAYFYSGLVKWALGVNSACDDFAIAKTENPEILIAHYCNAKNLIYFNKEIEKYCPQ